MKVAGTSAEAEIMQPIHSSDPADLTNFAGETRPLLLAVVGGEPPDETVDRRAVASGGITEAVGAGKSIQGEKVTEGCLTKADGRP